MTCFCLFQISLFALAPDRPVITCKTSNKLSDVSKSKSRSRRWSIINQLILAPRRQHMLYSTLILCTTFSDMSGTTEHTKVHGQPTQRHLQLGVVNFPLIVVTRRLWRKPDWSSFTWECQTCSIETIHWALMGSGHASGMFVYPSNIRASQNREIDVDTAWWYRHYTAVEELMSLHCYAGAHQLTQQQTVREFGRRHAWHVGTLYMKQIKQQKLSGSQS